MSNFFYELKHASKNLLITLGVVSCLLVICLIISLSYAYYTFSDDIKNRNIASSACFELSFSGKNDISLENTIPLSEEEASSLTPYTFTVKNVCNVISSFNVNIETLSTTDMDLNAVRYKIDNNSSNILGSVESNALKLLDNASSSKTILSGVLLENEELTFNLRLWIDENATVAQSSNKTFEGKIVVVSSLEKNPYYKLTINKNNGEEPNIVDVIKGRNVSDLQTPSRDGYEFLGWYSDSCLTNSFNSESTVDSNMSIYAKWNVKIEPELYDGLIAVTIDDSGTTKGTVRKADISSSWFDYDNHKWANAVIVNDLETYENAPVGSEILMSDILQMYVWIPRYRYTLFNTENSVSSEQIIDIEFEDTLTYKSNGSLNGSCLSHPAFTFGESELNGFWVGKFEPHSTNCAQYDCNDLNCSISECDKINTIRIKPDVNQLMNQKMNSMFYFSRNIESESTFNLNANQVDTHMMKNMEWAAVAYLANSKYGIYENSNTCVSSALNYESSVGNRCKIWANPHYKSSNRTRLTGCSYTSSNASNYGTCYSWNDQIYGGNTSTTGNVYGIYDMRGGSNEYVMANFSTTSPYSYNAGSSNLLEVESKYIDKYINTLDSTNAYSITKLGDALREVKVADGTSWFNESLYTPYRGSGWLVRGGSNISGGQSGLFHAVNYNGKENGYNSFRIVMTKEG